MVFSKLTKWQQDGDFLIRLSQLLSQGFSIEVAISYLSLTNPSQKKNYQKILTELEKGELFADALKKAGFPALVYAPLFYASEHNYFQKTIGDCGQLLLKKVQQQRALQKTLRYPFILFATIFIIFILLKVFLLPKFKILFTQLAHKGSPVATFHSFVFDYLPWLFLIFFITFIFSIVLFKKRINPKKILTHIRSLCKIPILRTFVRLHYSQLVARECGYLLASGLSLSSCLALFQRENSPILFREISFYLEERLSKGQTISEALQKIGIFDRSFIYVIQHGEKNGTLANELLFYFKLCNEQILAKTEKLFTFIQPITFLIIGLLIISIYLSILFPMFSMIDQF